MSTAKKIRIADVIDSGSSNESGDGMQDDDDLEGDVEALKLEDDSPVAKKKPETTNFTTTAATKPPEEN